MTTKRIIVVLDYPSMESALAFAENLDPTLCRVKVGKELFTAAGPAVVDALMSRGFDVFLDLKFHDIPNTVAGACRVAARLGVWMINVHASGGRKMLAAVRDAITKESHQPLLIGVTVLTSMSSSDLSEIGVVGGAEEQVSRLADLCFSEGLDGVVCSAEEAPLLTRHFTGGRPFLKVTPGIRLAGDAKGDQQRVVTPVDALKMGADYLVIGRSITHAADPIATLNHINQLLRAHDHASGM
jgi:orotidine-5'-phosphate decarboxylase